MNKFLQKFVDVWSVFTREMRIILTDMGVILIFFIAGFLYPVLYNVIYWNDDINDVPVAIVDDSKSEASRSFIYRLDATPQVVVTAGCVNMEEAKELLRNGKVHGIIYFPRDFETNLTSIEAQSHISLYLDMSSFLYFKNIYMGCNYVMLDMSHNIQIKRYAMTGRVGDLGEQMVTAVPYESVALYTPTGGYSSFLIPAILIVIIHQTLFFGIGMLAGAEREEKRRLYELPGRGHRHSILRIIMGKASAYFLVYVLIGTWCLLAIPKLFHLPHVGQPLDIIGFMLPFLLATIFFSMFMSCFVRNRETGMVLNLSLTLFVLFVSGVSWPQASVPPFWRYVSYILPSTWGIHGFVHINSMGAHLSQTSHEIFALWVQTAIYFVLSCAALFYEKWRVQNYVEVNEADATMPLSQFFRLKIINILNALSTIWSPLQRFIQPVTKPIMKVVDPVTKPIVDLTGTVINEVIIKPIEGTVDSLDEAIGHLSSNEDYSNEDELLIGKDEDELETSQEQSPEPEPEVTEPSTAPSAAPSTESKQESEQEPESEPEFESESMAESEQEPESESPQETPES